jgi:hypothetical protein
MTLQISHKTIINKSKESVIVMIWLMLSLCLRAIQIIRDTLGGSAMCHTKFFHFFNIVFKAFGSENFCLTARLGLKDTFFLFHFAVKSKLGLKSGIKKDEDNVTRGGGKGHI